MERRAVLGNVIYLEFLLDGVIKMCNSVGKSTSRLVFFFNRMHFPFNCYFDLLFKYC